MRKQQLDLLRELVVTPSPSGFERRVAEFIAKQIPAGGLSVEIDFQHNVIVVVPGETNDYVMIDAHLDQIGFIVNNIDDNGQISLLPIGGAEASIMSNKNLVILTEKGPINAVVNRKPAHQIENSEDEAIEAAHEALVDIGIRGDKAVRKIVEIGDPVIYKPMFEPLAGDYYTGSGLDDKVGCFVLIEVIRNILKAKEKPQNTLVFTFSSQEETGGRKCRPLLKRFGPSTFIGVDVTFASDWDEKSWDHERQVGRCVLGEGPVLYRGVDIDPTVVKWLRTDARKHRVPIQIQASTGDVGYTAAEVSNEAHGIRAMVFGIPLRNMHSAVEIVNTKDLMQCVKLLSASLVKRPYGRIHDAATR